MEFDNAQQEAVDKLRSGSILCGGVGSGKSRTSLVYYYTKECGGSIKPKLEPMRNPKDLYIFTTAKKRDSSEWELELASFGLSCKSDNPIKITIDSWNNIAKYTNITDSFIIFDEQRLVGSGAWVNAFYKMTGSGRYFGRKPNNHWILLTATPGDTWTDYIPVFVANGFYRNKTDFSNQHIVYKRYTNYPSIDKFIDEQKLEKLRDHILVDIRIERHTVRHYEDVVVPYDNGLVKRVMKDRWDIYEEEPIKDAARLCYVMRRIVNDNGERLDAVRWLTVTHPKLIVFYNFDYELEILRTTLDEMNIAYSEWNGHRHQEIPNTDRWVYLVQYSAGAEGWNCIETDTIVFFSLNYSYKITEQACGRIDRRNTPFTDLYYYFLKSNSWIDRAIYKSLRTKKNFNEKRECKSIKFD